MAILYNSKVISCLVLHTRHVVHIWWQTTISFSQETIILKSSNMQCTSYWMDSTMANSWNTVTPKESFFHHNFNNRAKRVSSLNLLFISTLKNVKMVTFQQKIRVIYYILKGSTWSSTLQSPTEVLHPCQNDDKNGWFIRRLTSLPCACLHLLAHFDQQAFIVS